MIILMLLAGFTPATDTSGVIGLLEVPQFAEVHECVEYRPPRLTVYADAGLKETAGELVGEGQSWGNWDGVARCGTAYKVTLASSTSDVSNDVPVDMHGYDAFGFLVTEERGEAYRLALYGGSVWVPRTSGMLHRVRDLLKDAAYFVPDRQVAMCREPDVACRSVAAPTGVFNTVVIHDWRELKGTVWLDATVNVVSDCFDEFDRRRIHELGVPAPFRTWLPLRDEQKRLNVWFPAKGC